MNGTGFAAEVTPTIIEFEVPVIEAVTVSVAVTSLVAGCVQRC